MGGTAIEIFVQQHHRPDRYPQWAFRDHARRWRRRHDARDLRTLTRLVVALALDASNMGLDLDFDQVGLFAAGKRHEGGPTGRAVFGCLAHVMHFCHYWQGGTITPAVSLTPRLLSPLAGTGRLGCTSTVGTRRLLALGAVQTLGQVADRGLKRCHFRLQGCFALEKPLVLRPPVIGLPLEPNIGLLRQHHGVLGKGRGAILVHRCHLAGGVHLGYGMFHGLRYTRFFWRMLFVLKGQRVRRIFTYKLSQLYDAPEVTAAI